MDILNEQLSSDTAITYSFRPHVLGQTLIDAQIPIIVHAQSYTMLNMIPLPDWQRFKRAVPW